MTKTEYNQYRQPSKKPIPNHLYDNNGNPRLSETQMSEMVEYEQIFGDRNNPSDIEDSAELPDLPVMEMSQDSVNDMVLLMKQLQKRNAEAGGADPTYSEKMDKLSQQMLETSRRQKQVIDAANNRTPSATNNDSLRSRPAWMSSDLSNPSPRVPGPRGRTAKQKMQIMKRQNIQSDDEGARDMGGAATSIADSDAENKEEEFIEDLP